MKLRKRIAAPLVGVAVSAVLTTSALSAATPERAAFPQQRLEALTLGSPLSVEGASLQGPAAQGPVQVFVRLSQPAASQYGGSRAAVLAEQAAFVARAQALAPSARVIGSVQTLLNAVALEVDAGEIDALSVDHAVRRIVKVADYRMDLSETVPYIGGDTLHGLGVTGAGVRIAVIDSGIDYTHANLGGAGTLAAYEAAWGTSINDARNKTTDGLFPTAKVVGGFDFVGETWPNTAALSPDPDPIGGPDLTTFGGHGTHVADIIAGANGVAPGAVLYAYKACSTPATSCSGLALIQAMEAAVDPNGDGDTSDHVDIINMSLGSTYGQPFDDDLSAAVDAATDLGVLTVASAGNSADKPYVTGSPAAALTALSVAQTMVPSAEAQLMRIVSPPATPADRGAVFQSWSTPLTGVIEGAVTYPAGPNVLGCNPFPAGSLTGQIVLVDRGVCAASIKISNIAAAGGILGIIGFVDASAPFNFAFGGGTPNIPGFAVSLNDANAIRSGQTVRFDPDNTFPLIGSMASTSSRGPMMDDNRIKPEIGAPGASVSAQSGTGTGTGAFGGTSGAAPMVTGAAALLFELNAPWTSPNSLKQALISNADNNILAPSVVANVIPDALAPISRIGGGEVRVDRAALSQAIVNPQDSSSNYTGGVSFGFVDVSKDTVTLTKDILISNNSWDRKTYTLTPLMRYADDAATGAVTISVPASVTLGPMAEKNIKVKLTIDGNKLRPNLMSSGAGLSQFNKGGDDPGPLTTNEYDGYIRFQSGAEELNIPWHVLPRKAADVRSLSGTELKFDENTGIGFVNLRNAGVGPAQNDAYSLIGLSDSKPEGARGAQSPMPDLKAWGVNTFFVGSACASQYLWAFAINTWERQSHLVPVSHQVGLDINRDGTFDFVVLNRDVSFSNITDGRQLTWVFNLAAGTASARFGAEHSMNTGNTVLYVCTSDVGLSQAAVEAGQLVDADLFAQDFYFGGEGDAIDPVTISPFHEQFLGLPDDIAPKSTGSMAVVDFGNWPGTTQELGILLLTNGDRGSTSRGGATQATEALRFARPGGNVHVE